jgi:hypothetical protein
MFIQHGAAPIATLNLSPGIPGPELTHSEIHATLRIAATEGIFVLDL